jgi:hypothetical protein
MTPYAAFGVLSQALIYAGIALLVLGGAIGWAKCRSTRRVR